MYTNQTKKLVTQYQPRAIICPHLRKLDILDFTMLYVVHIGFTYAYLASLGFNWVHIRPAKSPNIPANGYFGDEEFLQQSA